MNQIDYNFVNELINCDFVSSVEVLKDDLHLCYAIDGDIDSFEKIYDVLSNIFDDDEIKILNDKIDLLLYSNNNKNDS